MTESTTSPQEITQPEINIVETTLQETNESKTNVEPGSDPHTPSSKNHLYRVLEHYTCQPVSISV
jgi:hypothetical protein